MSKIFITGVSGFAGSSLVNFLHSIDEIKLFGHSRDKIKTEKQFAHLPVSIVGEYTTELSDELDIDCVIHLAGIAHDLSNQYSDEDYYKTNYENTKKLYSEFLKSKAVRFIFLSSIKAVIDVGSALVDETVKPEPVTHYGKSKLMAEEYIQSVELPKGKSYYIFRPCMIHGPGNKGNLNLLYKFVRTGLPYPLGAFHNQRSFLNSDNFNFITLQFTKGNIASGIYHLADDEFLSTTQLYETIALALEKRSKVWNIPAALIKAGFSIIGKRGMLNKLTENMMVSNKKLLTAINQPLPVGIKEGVRKTIHSFNG